MRNITKQDLILEIAKSTGFIQGDIRAVVEEFFNSTAEFLAREKTIEIRGFGTFHTKIRKPRPARNPKTGEIVQLGTRIAPLFKFSADLKNKMNQRIPDELIKNDQRTATHPWD